jgi:tetrahydromethanopterin S-methyltransferase subunit A
MPEKHEPELLDKKSPLHALMRLLGHLMSTGEEGDNTRVVQMIHLFDGLKDLLKVGPLRLFWRQGSKKVVWPVTSGSYILGNPSAVVAVCTLTSPELMQPLASVPGVAIAGRVYTPNLGIEKIIRNVTTNPAIRFLFLCGKESPVFYPAQALRALFVEGVSPDKQIIDAQGPFPVLKNISPEQIAAFRRQVELVDYTGTTDLAQLTLYIQALTERDPGPLTERWEEHEKRPFTHMDEEQPERFIRLKPGGKRESLAYDPKGFFIITLDRKKNEIIIRHYLPDNQPAHEMRGRSAESLLLGLLRENLISQLSHAGYLGAEFAKAETALRFGWQYEQDRPLRSDTHYSVSEKARID